jgi:hypothetical protein
MWQPQRGGIFIANAVSLKMSPSGAAHITRDVAPLGLKCAKRDTRARSAIPRPSGAEARGIAAEPPKRMRAKPEMREGDGADSPTRARKAGEAARPKLQKKRARKDD